MSTHRPDNPSNDMPENQDELQRLYRQAAKQEPSAQLDQRILRHARQQQASAPHNRFSAWLQQWLPLRSWRYGVTAFASMALAAVIVVQVADQEGVPSHPLPFEQEVSSPTGSGMAAPQDTGQSSVAQRDSNTPSSDSSTTNVLDDKQSVSDTAEPYSPSPVRAPAELAQTAREDSAQKAGHDSESNRNSDTDSGATGNRSNQPEQRRLRQSQPKLELQREAPADPPQSAAPAEQTALEERATRSEADQSSVQPQQSLQSQPAPPPAAPTTQADTSELPPDQWLQQIRGMIDSGEIEAAKREMDAFLEAYPNRVIPDDLKRIQPGSED